MAGNARYPLVADWQPRPLEALTLKIGSGSTPTGGERTYLPVRDRAALIRSQNVLDRRFSEDGLAFISDTQADALTGVALQPDDVLLNITGDGVTFGRSCIVPAEILPAYVNQHVSIIRADKKKLDAKYLLAYLTHPSVKHYIESFNAGGSRRAITKGHIESFSVPVAPLEIQREIGEILGVIDNKIALNLRTNRTLEELVTVTFKSWFVVFNPVTAKRDGKMPVGVPGSAIDLFPSHFEESELGPIPHGWIPARVGDHFHVTMGQSPPGSTYNDIGDGLPFYQGRTDFGFRYPTRLVYCTAPTRFAESGDTLVSVRAPVGDANMASERCAIGRGVAAVSHKHNNPSFTYYAMRSLRDEFDVYESEGTLFGAIGGDDFRRLRFVHPPVTVLKPFEALIGLVCLVALFAFVPCPSSHGRI